MKKIDNVELGKILHKMNYVVNESPRYREIMNNDNFDAYPDKLGEADEDPTKDPSMPPPADPSMPPPADPAGMPPLPQDSTVAGMPPPVGASAMPPAGAPASPPLPDAGIPSPDAGMPPPPPTGMPSDMGVPAQEPDVDTLQNDIIQSNITAMRDIHSQLNSLNSYVDSLNSKLDSMNKEVQEVKEPTNAEKLMSKKNVSYPYYFNLNDYWKNNWFNQQTEDTDGIKQLDDGTYVANFDDLPVSDDLNDSFNKIT